MFYLMTTDQEKMDKQLLQLKSTNRRFDCAKGLLFTFWWSKLLRLYSFGGKFKFCLSTPNVYDWFFLLSRTELFINSIKIRAPLFFLLKKKIVPTKIHEYLSNPLTDLIEFACECLEFHDGSDFVTCWVQFAEKFS